MLRSETELVGGRETPSRRRFLLEAVVAALLVLSVYLALRPDPVRSLGTMYDDVVYVSLAKSIAKDTGIRLGELDPLETGELSAESYLNGMRRNAGALLKGLE